MPKLGRVQIERGGQSHRRSPDIGDFTGSSARIRATSGRDRTLTYAPPPASEWLARKDVVTYFERVLARGGRVILTPKFPYFGIIPGFRMGPEICVRCGERPVRLPLGRRGRRATTCTVCGHRRRERAPGGMA